MPVELYKKGPLEKMKIERIGREEIVKGSILTYCHDTVRIPNGNIRVWDYISHQGAAAVLPVDDEGRIILVRQYRNAFDRFMIEIPAGGLESPDEPTRDAAIRELTEETGFTASDVSFLMAFYPTVAYSGEKIDIYLAKGLKRAERHLDADEYINVEAWDINELMKMIFSGQLNDGKTVAAVSAYAFLTK